MCYLPCMLLSIGLLLLAGCATANDPAQVIEDFFQAVVADDSERLAELTCTAYEAEALMLATSYRNLNAELQDLSCQQDDTSCPDPLKCPERRA